ncbi:hypothetical protein KBD34_04220 [Patescibacteria group bacterium]|nr:hypothetical protein [Patescibacteria group bacterium]
MTKKPLLSLVSFLALVVLMGAGCRSRARTPEPTPEYPFGSETPVEPAPEAEVSACGNEYYPLRAGYTIAYRTQGGTGGSNTSRVNVLEATASKAVVKNSISRPGVPPLEITLEYKCENGSLVAKGFADAISLTEADGAMARGADIETLSSEGQFMPARISAGQEWDAKYTIKLTPRGRPDVLDKRAGVVKMEVAIRRAAVEKETVTVPAGRFEAMRIISSTDFNGNTISSGVEWWVKGKGMVKSVQGTLGGAVTMEATEVGTSR